MIGVSIALSISNIPWKGPISGVSVGYIDGEYIINPTAEQRERSEMAVTVASTDKLVAMIEAGAKEVSNDVMFNGIMAGHEAKPADHRIHQRNPAGSWPRKIDFPSNDPSPELFEAVKAFAIDDVRAAA